MARLDAVRFLKSLKAGKRVPAVLLLGPDAYLRELCRQRLIETFVDEAARPWCVARYSARETKLDVILQQAETRPMLSAHQCVAVTDVEALEELAENSRKAAVERLGAYLADPAPFTILVCEAASLDRRMTLFKTFSAHATVVAADLGGDEADGAELAAQLTREMAREQGLELEEDLARELADLLELDLARVRTEVAKLAAYVGEGNRATRDDVAAVVVAQKNYTIWQLTEIMASGDPHKALVFLDSILRLGEEPVSIVGALAWMVRKLIEAQEMPWHTEAWQAAQKLQMRAPAAQLAVAESKKIPRGKLLDALRDLHEADSRLKLGNAPPRAVLEFLVARLASPAAR